MHSPEGKQEQRIIKQKVLRHIHRKYNTNNINKSFKKESKMSWKKISLDLGEIWRSRKQYICLWSYIRLKNRESLPRCKLE